jgi:hypothetical protein
VQVIAKPIAAAAMSAAGSARAAALDVEHAIDASSC